MTTLPDNVYSQATLLDYWLSQPALAPASQVQGYGRDIYCYDDVDPLGREVEGLEVVAQNVYRRISTRRGSVVGAPDYGLDIRGFLHKGLTPRERAAVPQQVKAEIEKEERILVADVTLQSLTSEAILLNVVCEADTGEFEFTVNVTQAAITIAGLSIE